MLWIALTFSMNIEHIVPWQRCSRRNALFQSHSHFPHLQFGIRVRVSWKTFAMTVEQIVKKLRKENKNSNITKKNTIGIAWETAQSGGNSQFYFPFRFLSFRFTSDYSRCFFFSFRVDFFFTHLPKLKTLLVALTTIFALSSFWFCHFQIVATISASPMSHDASCVVDVSAIYYYSRFHFIQFYSNSSAQTFTSVRAECHTKQEIENGK